MKIFVFEVKWEKSLSHSLCNLGDLVEELGLKLICPSTLHKPCQQPFIKYFLKLKLTPRTVCLRGTCQYSVEADTAAEKWERLCGFQKDAERNETNVRSYNLLLTPNWSWFCTWRGTHNHQKKPPDYARSGWTTHQHAHQHTCHAYSHTWTTQQSLLSACLFSHPLWRMFRFIWCVKSTQLVFISVLNRFTPVTADSHQQQPNMLINFNFKLQKKAKACWTWIYLLLVEL